MDKVTIQILSGGYIQEPPVLEGITWETVRKGEPSRLRFTCIKTDGLSFSEGSEVIMKLGNYNVFHGFVFEKRRNKDHHIEVLCYDQLRYLKNQTSYLWYGIRADQVVSRIAEDFKLQTGKLPNTGHVIPKFEASDSTLFDIILDAIDETLDATGNLYYIYDDFGKIQLKNIKDSLLDVVVCDSTASDFDYTTSIDRSTYNRIILVDSENKAEANLKKATDMKNVQQWGVLQKVESVSSGTNTQAMANAMLKFYNKVSRSLVIKGQLGDITVRAGCGIYLDLNLGDMIARQRMLVEKAVHTFNNDDHFMDLTLIGNEEFYD